MTVGEGVLLGSYGLATGIGAVVALVVWRHRGKTGALPLAGALVGTVIVSGSRFVATAADSYALSVLMERTLYVGIGLSVAAIVVFALVYTGRERYVTPKTIGLLSIEPLLVVILAFTNPATVFFESFEPDPTLATGVGVEWGPAFVAHTLYSYLLLAGTTYLILSFLISSRALYRGQALALLGGTTVPWLANAVHVVGPVTADTTPIGYVLMGGLNAIAIVRYQLIDIVPIARDRVLDTVNEGVFVVDRDDRLVDINPAGRELIGAETTNSLVGTNVETIFASDPALRERFHELTASKEPTRVQLAYDGADYEVRATPITDDRDRHVGWLLLVTDITDRKHRERELRRHNDRLEEFAQVVSHDLRNPLNVASGYVDLARETNDPAHLEEIEQAHDRMETIIEDVLELARTGEPVTDPESVSLEAVATQAWDSVETGEATLTVQRDVHLQADPSRLTRLLENVFRNAVTHGRPDGGFDGESARSHSPIEVTVGPIGEPEADSLEGIFVADDGVGIPESERDRIFDSGVTTGADGTGLGLSIVEQIATDHGWSVAVTDSEDGGARFEFTGLESVSRDQPRDAASQPDPQRP
ncbi:PAS domain S-box protein [Salinadaptatus halalkaliphilus]|uniref:histidine kinase n=1 Tax=Salinadaptatus halalkaliphilus TaxID=2419781 RepID=A0A4S3THC5_9EURY|nr:histidine kinase N-terminal 7TM domain-containing protein [Salinadaptatus halalkaliphilus]THE63369.1 PAS domain S-box protein [Salinadaptatus halalkaliphilus]